MMFRRLTLLAGFALVAATCSAGTVTRETTTTIATTTVSTDDGATSTATSVITTTTTEAEVVWPPALVAPSLAYDEESNALVMFGGAPGPSDAGSNDTWVYDLDTGSWTDSSLAIGPSSRYWASMVYDRDSDRMVLIGGVTMETRLLDTWIYDADDNTWSNLGRGPISPQREEAENLGLWWAPRTVYHSGADQVVAFSGFSQTATFHFHDETWGYDYESNTWTQLDSVNAPDPRDAAAIGFDAESNVVLVWGGVTESVMAQLTPDADYDDAVWTYDLETGTWTELENLGGPQAWGYDYPAAFDAESDRLVVIQPFGEFWSYDYDGNLWEVLSPVEPYPRLTVTPGVTYLGGDVDRIAVFGGCDTQFVWIGHLTDFGSQCTNELWFYDLNTNTWEKIGPPGQ